MSSIKLRVEHNHHLRIEISPWFSSERDIFLISLKVISGFLPKFINRN